MISLEKPQRKWASSRLEGKTSWIFVQVAAGPTKAMMQAILDTVPFGDPQRGVDLLSRWAQGIGESTAHRVQRQVQIGMLNEESIGQMVRRIRGVRGPGGRFFGGALETTRRQAEGLVRTAVTETAARAQLETYKANADIVTAYQYFATLDSRTTQICISLDGQVFPVDSDKPTPTPPQHFNCRSRLVPVVDWKGLGVDPPPDSERIARDPEGRSVRVDAGEVYKDWLRKQPTGAQNQILGKSRAEMFRQGKLDLSELVRGDKRKTAIGPLLARARETAENI